MVSGVSLGSFSGRPDGMQQRSYSVSSADQWSEATVIANSAISSGKRGRSPTDPRPPTVLGVSQGPGAAPRVQAPWGGRVSGARVPFDPCRSIWSLTEVSRTPSHVFLLVREEQVACQIWGVRLHTGQSGFPTVP